MNTTGSPGNVVDLHGYETRVGELLTERRGELSRSRAIMARSAGVSYRMLQDIELGNRQRYNVVNIGKIEDAYGWARGSILGITRGGTPAPAAAGDPGEGDASGDPVRMETRVTRTDFGEFIDRIVHDAAGELDDMTEEEAEEALQRVIEDLNVQTRVALDRERRRVERDRGRRDETDSAGDSDA